MWQPCSLHLLTDTLRFCGTSYLFNVLQENVLLYFCF
uniref:Uncharacterized protein n=1 Tax=Anguilla anguilla TaxID=7936 RepID=A0A0E9WA82_ANGAN